MTDVVSNPTIGLQETRIFASLPMMSPRAVYSRKKRPSFSLSVGLLDSTGRATEAFTRSKAP